MPIVSISSDQAFANLRGNPNSIWPDGRRDRSRLASVAEVEIRADFQLVPGEAVFTTGSCFARNIEQRFVELGFDLPALAFEVPAEERASDTANDFLNKYPPHAILNEFRWALDPAHAFPSQGYLKIGRDLWHDPHSAPNLKPASLARVKERRGMVEALYRQVPRCRVVVVTLGLVEAWYDAATGLYLNGAPPREALKAEPRRFRLEVLTVDDVVRALRELHELLVRFGHPDFRMLLSVSPVPLKTTFTGRDVIAANTYSKSALRAAAELFLIDHPRAAYVPSYEIVTYTPRSSAYIQDNRHVTPAIVDIIVNRVARAYAPESAAGAEAKVERANRLTARSIRAAMRSDPAQALSLFAQLDRDGQYLAVGMTEHQFRYAYGQALQKTGGLAEAQIQLSRAVAADPSSAKACYQLARTLARLQRPLEAEQHFRRAAALQPGDAAFRTALGNQLLKLGRLAEAEAETLSLLAAHPDYEPARTLLKAIEAKAGDAAGDGRPPERKEVPVAAGIGA